MAKLERVTAKIFASNADEGDIGQFGSAKTGTKVLTGDIAEIQALPAYVEGWRGAVTPNRNYPPLQEMNGLQKVFSQQIAYIMQQGLPEYDPETAYYLDSWCKGLDGNGNSIIYKSLIDDNIGNPLTDTNSWEAVTFGGGSGSGTSLPLFTPILQDRILTYEETKGYALCGDWVYSTAVVGERFGYPTFVNICKQEYNEATPTTITAAGITINVRKHINGHIYYLPAEEANVNKIFDATGEAWYYCLDEANNRVRMPRTKFIISDTQTKLASTIPTSPSVFGNGKALVYQGANNLPYLQYWTNTDNHRNNHPASNTTNPPKNNYNALTKLSGEGSWDSIGGTGASIGLATKAQASGQGLNHVGLVLDTSGFKVSATNTTVNTEKQAFFYYYIVVGNTVSDTSWINVVEEVEGGVKEIVDAGDIQVARIQALDGLKTDRLTNCILEAPNMFNMSIVNNQVHLDAGAKVIVPYGTEAPTMAIGDPLNTGTIVDISWDGSKLFYIVQYDEEKVTSSILNPSNTRFTGINPSGVIWRFGVNQSFAQATEPDWGIWYDTANNIVKLKNETDTEWVPYYSLPMGKIQETANVGTTAILETYQSMGVIARTVFWHKGIKVLMPNGRNPDGTLNNILYTVENEMTFSLSSFTSDRYILICTDPLNPIIYWNPSQYFVQDNAPVTPATGVYAIWYSPKDNLYKTTINGNDWEIVHCTLYARITSTTGAITSITQEPVMQLITNTGGEIQGQLKFTGVPTPITCRFPNIDFTKTPTANTYGEIRFEDTNGKRAGVLELGQYPDGSHSLNLISTFQNADGTEKNHAIKTGYLADGTAYAELSASPAAASNGTSIATTAWVRGKGVLINKYINGKSWYRIYSDGWCEQAGITTNTVTSATITFLKTFKDTNYTITLGDGNPTSTDTGGVADSANYKQTTTTGFGISLVKGRSVFWKAEGYLAAGQY